MNQQDIKILIKENKVITLKELYREYEKTHAQQAKLPFEEKIKILVDLQKIANSWGKKDIIIWKIS
ncbi:MAG: hypothetical protein ACK4F0_03365 [Candidatus Ratteibacteria bacterium]